jgi:hypothetical protein
MVLSYHLLLRRLFTSDLREQLPILEVTDQEWDGHFVALNLFSVVELVYFDFVLSHSKVASKCSVAWSAESVALIVP